jgi:hypothetical protein
VGKQDGRGWRLTEALFELAELFESVEAATFSFVLGEGWRGRRWGRGRWFQADLADEEVFLKAIGLEEVGEFEGADVTAALPDLALQISDDPAQVLGGEAGPQPFIPLTLAVKAQAHGLARQLAVELMDGLDLFWTDGLWHRRLTFQPPGRPRPSPAPRGLAPGPG